MSGTNEDYKRRLKQDGRADLIRRIEDPDDEMSLYAASVQMGYRKLGSAKTRAEQISYHWRRADEFQKQQFVLDNWQSVAPLVSKLLKNQLAKNKAKKTSQ